VLPGNFGEEKGGFFGGVAGTGHLRRVRILRPEQEMAKRGWSVANECARDRDAEMQAIRASIRLIAGVCAAPVVLKPVTALLQFSTVTCLLFAPNAVHPHHTAPRAPSDSPTFSPNSKTSTPRARLAPGSPLQRAQHSLRQRFCIDAYDAFRAPLLNVELRPVLAARRASSQDHAAAGCACHMTCVGR
jgi:hypothetical protein